MFFRFDRKRDIYRILLLFDLAFVYLLIVHSGGFASGFFLGFYLLTALHSFYYGIAADLIATGEDMDGTSRSRPARHPALVIPSGGT